jgi:predicted phage tail component-like protein
MANSFTYRGIDLSAYGLVVTSHDIPMTHDVDAVQLHYRSFATDSKIGSKAIQMGIAITASDTTTLKTYIDTIKRILNTQTDETLILDAYNDRYWTARFKSFEGSLKALMFTGTVSFICLDPYAHDNAEVSNDYTDDEEPETIIETPGGTALIEPVFVLTSSINDGTADIKVRNDTLGMEIEWTGAITIGGQIEIDSSEWVVKLNGSESMSTVTGQFPVLSPGVDNSFEISGFTGNLNITYRNRYC